MRISKVPWPSWIWNSRLEKLVKWSRSGIGQDSIRQTWYVRVEGFSALASLNSLQFHVVYFCSSPFSKTQNILPGTFDITNQSLFLKIVIFVVVWWSDGIRFEWDLLRGWNSRHQILFRWWTVHRKPEFYSIQKSGAICEQVHTLLSVLNVAES